MYADFSLFPRQMQQDKNITQVYLYHIMPCYVKSKQAKLCPQNLTKDTELPIQRFNNFNLLFKKFPISQKILHQYPRTIYNQPFSH